MQKNLGEVKLETLQANKANVLCDARLIELNYVN